MRKNPPETIDPTEKLLQELDWLRALAHALVGRDGEADDLVQEASLAALAHPPAEGGLRAWLWRVTVNHLAFQARCDRRRLARERARARARTAPATDETCARLETQHLVVEELRALPRIYREALTLRFLEGLRPRRIADALGAPVETVKSRLKRGLALLRQRLEKRLGPGRDWRAALAPLLLPPLGKSLLASSIPLLAATAMKTKLLVPIALAALIIPVLIWNDGASPPREAVSAPRAEKEERAGDSREELAILRSPLQEPERSDQLTPPEPEEERALRIQVVDRAGKPLEGIPIAVWLSSPPHSKPVWTDLTRGARAIARVEDLPDWDPEHQEMYAFIDVRVPNPPRYVLERGVIPDQPIQLVMPPCGDLVLNIRHASGEELFSQSSAMLTLVEATPRIRPLPGSLLSGEREGIFAGPDQKRLPFCNHRQMKRVLAEDHRLHFPHVGLGLNLEVKGGSYLIRGAEFELIVDGPHAEGEIAERDIVLDHPLFLARILDASGTPLRRTELTLWSEDSTGSTASNRIKARTDEHGMLRCVRECEGRSRRTRYLIATLSVENHGKRGIDSIISHGPSVRVSLPQEHRAGVTDLGDLTLTPPPILARGRVVDGEGIPVPGALVAREVPGPPHLRTWTWRPHPACTETDPQGRFVLRGFQRDTELLLRVLKEGMNDTLATTQEGLTEELVLRMVSSAVIEGRVLVDAEVPVEWLTLELRQGDQKIRQASPTPAGTFRFEKIAPGRYTLKIDTAAADLMCIEDLELHPGEVLRDPRLDPIDLRARLRFLELQVEDTSRERRPSIVFSVRGDGITNNGFLSGCINRNRARFILPAEVTAFRFVATGYRSQQLNTVPRRQRILLQPELRFQVELARPGCIPEPPDYLELHLHRLDDSATARRSTRAGFFANSPSASFALDAPGRFRAEWVLIRKLSAKQKPSVILEDAQLLAIEESTAGEVLRLAPSSEALERAKRELDREVSED